LIKIDKISPKLQSNLRVHCFSYKNIHAAWKVNIAFSTLVATLCGSIRGHMTHTSRHKAIERKNENTIKNTWLSILLFVFPPFEIKIWNMSKGRNGKQRAELWIKINNVRSSKIVMATHEGEKSNQNIGNRWVLTSW
jgi:hypothetical protein